MTARQGSARALVALGAAVIVLGGLGLALVWGRSETRHARPSAGGGRATSTSASAIGTGAGSSSSSGTTTSGRTSTTAPAESLDAFLAAFTQAIRTGDATFLYDRLNPAVIKRFGADPCKASVQLYRDETAAFTVVAVKGTGDFTWTTGGRSTTVPDTLTVEVDQVERGERARVEVHFTAVNGRFTWFRDCTR